jgi:tetratricopeptide (TPR) repeat protein
LLIKTEFFYFPIVLFLFFKQTDPMRLRLLFTCLLLCWIGTSLQAKPDMNRLDLYYGMAEGNYLIGDLGGAERGIDQMLRIAPDHVPALTLQARVRVAREKPDEALEAIEQVIDLEPENSEHRRLKAFILSHKARSAIRSGEPKVAVDALNQAITIYEGKSGREALERSTELRLMRARLLAQSGQPESAITDLQALTGQQSENFEALITLASIYASVDRWASLETLVPSIAARPELQDVALYLEGRAALARDRVGTAREKFETALDALPDDADNLRRSLYFYRGVCLLRLDRRGEAQSAILNAIDAGFRPETSEEAIIASQALLREKRAETAIPLLEAITLNRIAPDAEIWAMLGRAHLANETPTLALSAFNEALKIDPDATETRALRGSTLRKIGDLAGALADYEEAQAQEPENGAIAYARGLVYLQLGRIAQANNAIAQAAGALPEQVGLQFLHALLLYTLGENESAKRALVRYQQQIPGHANPTADYLGYLLNGTKPGAGPRNAVRRYFSGSYTLKEALDEAGRAETPEKARKQIVTTAFWMAQFEREQGDIEQSRKLLRIAINSGDPDLAEYQLARWQLEGLQNPAGR